MAEQPNLLEKYALTFTNPQPGARSRVFETRNAIVLLDLFGAEVIAQQEKIIEEIRNILKEEKTEKSELAISKSNDVIYSARRPGVSQGGSILVAMTQPSGLLARGYGNCHIWLVPGSADKSAAIKQLDDGRAAGYLGSYQVNPQNFLRLEKELAAGDWLILTTNRLSQAAIERLPKKDAKQFIKAVEREYGQEAVAVLQGPSDPADKQAKGRLSAGGAVAKSISAILIMIAVGVCVWLAAEFIFPSPDETTEPPPPPPSAPMTATPNATLTLSAAQIASAMSTPSVTSTPSATSVPTATTLPPTSTVAPTLTPTRTPTPVPPTATATPAPTVALTKAAPHPMAPAGENPYPELSPQTVLFEWSATRDEAIGEVYRFEILRDDTVIISRDKLDSASALIPVVGLQKEHELLWRVRTEIVQQDQSIPTSDWSTPLKFKITVKIEEPDCPEQNQTLTGCKQ